MKPEHLHGQLRVLKPLLRDQLKAKEKLQKYWSDKMALVWTINDIHKAANERGLALTKKEAKALLDDLSKHYNPQYGIKWIDRWDLIENSGFGRKMTKREITSFVERNMVTIASSKHTTR